MHVIYFFLWTFVYFHQWKNLNYFFFFLNCIIILIFMYATLLSCSHKKRDALVSSKDWVCFCVQYQSFFFFILYFSFQPWWSPSFWTPADLFLFFSLITHFLWYFDTIDDTTKVPNWMVRSRLMDLADQHSMCMRMMMTLRSMLSPSLRRRHMDSQLLQASMLQRNENNWKELIIFACMQPPCHEIFSCCHLFKENVKKYVNDNRSHFLFISFAQKNSNSFCWFIF